MGAEAKRSVDTLIVNGTLVTLDGENLRCHPGAVAIEGSNIVAVGDSADLTSRITASTTMDAAGKLVLPGMTNTHTHLFQTPLKGLGNELPLHEWIKRVPADTLLEMDERTLYLGALVGCLGALRSGTTTFLDFMYPNPRREAYDAILRAIWDSGIRALLGRGVADIASADGYPVTGYHPGLIEPLDSALEDCERLHRLCTESADARVKLCLAPPNMRTLTPDALKALREFAIEHDTTMSMHLCESRRDDEISKERYGLTSVEWLDSLGVLSESFVAVHCVNLGPEAIRIFAERGVNVSYNPVSNMYVGNGIAPIRALREAGVRVTFGTDGAAVNTNDLLETLKIGTLLERVAALNPAAVAAEDALRMATIEGARALGMGASVGSIEVGKKADLVIADLGNVRSAPYHDPISTLVFSSNSEIIDTVLVNGRVLLLDGRFVHVDENEILDEAQERARDLARATGWD